MNDLIIFFILELLFSSIKNTEIWMIITMTLSEKLNQIIKTVCKNLQPRIMKIMRAITSADD